MAAGQFTIDRLYTKDLYVNGAQITHPSLAALLTDHPSNNVGIGTNDPKVKLDINGTNALRLPAGNKMVGVGGDRPADADANYCIRYNTDDNIFEGYSNGNWGSLGGVTSINQKVTITADNTDGLKFLTGPDGGSSLERMRILNNGQVNIGGITDVESVINSKAATTYVDNQITNLIGGAPGALDTLNELAAALGDDASYATTVTNNLASKQATITGAASTITSSNLTASSVCITDSNGKIGAHYSITTTELGYLDGVTSGIQTQLGTKAPLASPSFTGTVSAGNVRLFNNSTTNAYFSNASNNTTSNYALRQSGDASTYLNVRSGGQVNLSIGGATKAALKSNGDFYFNNNVGIGTSTPTTKLQVGNVNDGFNNFQTGNIVWDTNALSIIHPTKTSNSATNDPVPVLYLGRKGTSGQAYGALSTFCISRYEDSYDSSRTRLDIKLEHGIPNPTSTSPTMTLLSSGKVGIGTSSPALPLDVHGSYIGRWKGKSNPHGYKHLEAARDSFYMGRWDGPNAQASDGCFLGMELKVDTASEIEAVGGTNSNQSAIMFHTWGSGLSNSREVMRIDSAGNVGIGTTSPTEKLHVSDNIKCSHILVHTIRELTHLHCTGNLAVGGSYGSTASADGGGHLSYQIGYNQGYGHGTIGICALKKTYTNKTRGLGYQSGTSNNWHVSIFSNGDMLCDGTYRSFSDRRIKKNIVELDDHESLNLLRKIEVKKYNYIDTDKGLYDVYGFIAQQIDTVKKGIVTKGSCFIPNIMKYYTAEIDTSNNEIIFTDLSGCTNISNSVGPSGEIIIRFEVKTQDKEEYNQLDLPLKKVVENKYYFPLPSSNKIESYIFVHGIYVHDFHTLDKHKIFALAFSATQEIDKIQQAEKTKLEAAETEITTLKDKVTSLETTITNLVARLTALETA